MTTHLNDSLSTLMSSAPRMSDAEWAAHDTRVGSVLAAKAREDNRANWVGVRDKLLLQGLSRLHLSELFVEKPEMIPAVQAVSKLEKVGLTVLAGNVGCGKTLAGHIWLLDALKTPPLEWRSSGVMRITSAWFARTSRYGAVDKFALLAAPQKLLIDDLGVEFADSAASHLTDLDELLDMRLCDLKPTVITTNLSSAVFRERYRRRIADRLKGGTRWFDVRHPSMRGGGE